MGVWIAVFIVMFMVGSLLWLLPSPVQRHQMRLRQAAMKGGFRVSFDEVPPVSLSGDGSEAAVRCVGYGISHQPMRMGQEKLETIRIIRARGQWRSGLPDAWCWSRNFFCRDRRFLDQLARLLEALPPEVLMVELGERRSVFFWQEKGGQPVLGAAMAAFGDYLGLPAGSEGNNPASH